MCISALVIISSATSSISSARSLAPQARTAARIMCRAWVRASGSPGATCCWSLAAGLRGVQGAAAQQEQRHVVVAAAFLGHVDEAVREVPYVVRS